MWAAFFHLLGFLAWYSYIQGMKWPVLILSFAMLSWSNLLFSQKIDSDKSFLKFELSHMKFSTIQGEFTGMTGDAFFSPTDLSSSSLDVCLDSKSVSTNDENRDETLNSEEYFHTSYYPEICFKSSKFQFTKGQFEVVGILTMRGVSKEVTIPFERHDDKFTATFTIKRLDYGIGSETGCFFLGNDVDLSIACYLES